MHAVDPARLQARANADPEFRLAARYWTATLSLERPPAALRVEIADGAVASCRTGAAGTPATITIAGPEAGWAEMLAPVPRPFYQDLLGGCVQHHGFTVAGDIAALSAYYQAVQRLLALMRPAPPAPAAAPTATAGASPARLDPAVGRYVYLAIAGVEYRVYFEEAGAGIPLLLQHTAGADGRQWRHLLADAEVLRHFRVIAYDLPYHGKSLPPTGLAWWAQEYRLTRAFLVQVPVSLAAALGLERPVFMGCSIGGHLAADLAAEHPGIFRAAIALEGALATPARRDLTFLHHPRISNEYRAALMYGITAPTSPEECRRETAWIYSQGAPGVFRGDLHYYNVDHDLTGAAAAIDTARTALYVLTGEYDWSSTPAMGRALAAQVPGATFRPMPGLGHFPMSEDPERFRAHLLPVLEEIRARHPR